MKSSAAMAAVVSLACAVSGCATVRTCDIGGRSTVAIENSCWQLFNFIPIASGDPLQPNKCACDWFTDTVTVRNNVKMLEAEMRRQGAYAVKDLTSRFTDEKVLFVLMRHKVCHTSAELIKEN